MHNKWQIWVGAAIIVLGVILLIGTVLDIDPWALCFPILLIVAGVLLLMRPQWIAAGRLKLLGSVRRYGTWQVADEEFTVGVGDVRLDLTGADIPEGETKLRAFAGVGNVTMRVPEGVGVSVSCMGFVTDAKVLGRKQVSFFTSFDATSDGYETTRRKVHLEVVNFVGDVRVRQVRAAGSTLDPLEQPLPSDDIPLE